MSFYGAIAGAGAYLLEKGGGYLFDKASPYLSRIGNWFTGLWGGGGGTSSNVGPTTMDEAYTKTINDTFDGVKKYANADYLKRKIPILNDIGQAGQALSDRLRGDDGWGPGPMLGKDGEGQMQGIERSRQASGSFSRR